MERSELVATTDDLMEIKNELNNTDEIEARTKERANKKSMFYSHKTQCFTALLREVLMGCENAVLPEPLTKNHIVYCPTRRENTRKPYTDDLCLYRNLRLH